MSAPDFTQFAKDMLAELRRDMSYDEVVAYLIQARLSQVRVAALEEAAAAAELHSRNADNQLNEIANDLRNGVVRFEVAGTGAIGLGNQSRDIAAAIRALKGGA